MTKPRDLSAFCEVLDTMFEWCDAAPAEAITGLGGMRVAANAVRSAIAHRSAESIATLNNSCSAAEDPGATGARQHILSAVFLVARGAMLDVPAGQDELAKAERLLLSHAVELGKILGVEDSGRIARLALDRGRSEGRRNDRFPEPGFARALIIGSLIVLYREIGRMTRADIVRSASGRGVKLTEALLARVEGGTASRGAPVDEIVRCLGQTPSEFHRRAEHAHGLATAIAATAAGKPTDPHRWFAETVSVYGERTARACVDVAVGASVRLKVEMLRR